jgi:hypothetical protein
MEVCHIACQEDTMCLRMNKHQHDALFILSLLRYHTYVCFGRISSLSSGGKMWQMVLVILLSWLSAAGPADRINSASCWLIFIQFKMHGQLNIKCVFGLGKGYVPFFKTPRPSLRHTQLLIKCVPGFFAGDVTLAIHFCLAPSPLAYWIYF